MTLTIDERQKKLQEIKSYDPLVIQNAKVSELKSLASGLLAGHSKMKKQELVEGLLLLSPNDESRPVDQMAPAEWIKEPLTRAEKEILGKVQSIDDPAYGIKDQLVKFCLEPLSGIPLKCRKLPEAQYVVKTLTFEILRSLSALYQPATQARHKTHFNNLIRAFAKSKVNNPDYRIAVLVCDQFIQNLNEAFGGAKAEANKNTEDKIVQKTKDEAEMEVIDLAPALNKAKIVLESFYKGNQEYDIADLTFALMIASGRRPIEIAELSAFELCGEYTLSFGDPAKLKGAMREYWDGRKEVIPTLIQAELVLSGIEELREKMAEGIKVASLQKKVQRLLPNKGYDRDGFSKPYRARAAYVHAAFANHNKGLYPELKANKLSLTGFGSTVLCHNPRDIATISSYLCTSLKPDHRGQTQTYL